jgi:hypothetical protein
VTELLRHLTAVIRDVERMILRTAVGPNGGNLQETKLRIVVELHKLYLSQNAIAVTKLKE